ncbi:hypothetical protein ACFY4B_26475 [Kitasatospora sp. NPDC001261]|uniref:hypothetical protein n=1 Tax=Kitasatospora sp. NPDC001261 TaxID=3364012 RepID=UPI00368238E3
MATPENPDRWWARRRDERLLALDLQMCAWEVPALGEVPFLDEVLEKVEHTLAWCAQAGEQQQESGRLLGPALEHLKAAERLDGTALALVNYHLRRAVDRVQKAAVLTPAPVRPTFSGQERGRGDHVGQPAATPQ